MDEASLETLPTATGAVDRLTDTTRAEARRAASGNTLKAYANDWAQFARWCRLKGVQQMPPTPESVGLYIADLASPQGKAALSLASIERRLSGLVWNCAQNGATLDRKDSRIATALAGIRQVHAASPKRKEAILPQDLFAMLDTLGHDLRGLRDRAILLIGSAGGLRRSEIVSIDLGKQHTPGTGGWIDIVEDGAVISLRGKAGWREVKVARGSSDQSCPVYALTQWLHFSKIESGPIFIGVSRDGRTTTGKRLSDKHVARLVKQTVKAAGLRPDLPEAERIRLYSSHSLRAGLASSAEVGARTAATGSGSI